MKTAEDEEFERIEKESGWRKRQIALDQKAENAKELGLDYAPTWVGLTRDEQSFVYDTLKNSTTRIDSFWVDFANAIEKALKDKNT
jgi:hypothetical protein